MLSCKRGKRQRQQKYIAKEMYTSAVLYNKSSNMTDNTIVIKEHVWSTWMGLVWINPFL